MGHTLDLECAQESDLDEVAAFISRIFGLREPGRVHSHAVMKWKYLDPHPFWSGGRSYVLRRNGAIVAHGCVVPGRYLAGGTPVTGSCIIDWAGDPAVPGSGALIYSKLCALSETMLGIGGSDEARRVVPRMGFRERQQLDTYVRVVRPWLLFRRQGRGSRAVARFGRNLVRSFQSGRRAGADWSAEPVARFDKSIEPVLPRAKDSDTVVCERSVAFLNYILECPAAEMEACKIFNRGMLVGYFVLSRVGLGCRIADLWIASERMEDWEPALSLALKQASRSRAVAEVVFATCSPRLRAAASRVGLVLRDRQPVFLRDRRNLLAGMPEIGLTSLDNDYFYL